MYLIECDDVVIYDIRMENRIVISPSLDLETGKNGTLKFTIPTQNIGYSLIKEKSSIIRVFRFDIVDNSIIQDELFRGSVYSIKKDFYNRKLVECERRTFFFK